MAALLRDAALSCRNTPTKGCGCRFVNREERNRKRDNEGTDAPAVGGGGGAADRRSPSLTLHVVK
jgi:hypothetical protein